MAIYIITQSSVDQNKCLKLPITFIHALFLEVPQKGFIGKKIELIPKWIKMGHL